MFGPRVAVSVTDPRNPKAPLWPAEAVAMTRATSARKSEFASGRAAARHAMQSLGHAPQAVPCGADRAPVWPRGLTGSISHTTGVCIAIVGETGSLRSVGVDVEDDSPLDDDLIPSVCTLAERAWLAIQPEAMRGNLAKLIFSAKECAYKCQFAVTGTLFDFDTLEITPDIDTGQFEATFTRDIAPFEAGTCFHGRFTVCQGVIVTAMVLARSPRWTMQGQ
ncbi:4'-phosphopantetheinyl transferase superfamily protein [Pseudohalocynthiibacter aestuariivivens]|nr:4'-phosphopantetheinyl transferase superfamily protein [Pseudohalocynthiibacter aestuariivivens]